MKAYISPNTNNLVIELEGREEEEVFHIKFDTSMGFLGRTRFERQDAMARRCDELNVLAGEMFSTYNRVRRQ